MVLFGRLTLSCLLRLNRVVTLVTGLGVLADVLPFLFPSYTLLVTWQKIAPYDILSVWVRSTGLKFLDLKPWKARELTLHEFG